MSRLLSNGRWFDLLNSRAILESDYEQSIRRHAAHLFPGYVCVPFKAIVEAEGGQRVKADLALVDHHYRRWTVVEVELDTHSLNRHVEPQMRKLVSGSYTDEHARAMAREAPELDEARLLHLVRSAVPDFMVIVPSELPSWRATLGNLGVSLATVQIFINAEDQRILRYEGDRPPQERADLVSRLLDPPFHTKGKRVELPATMPVDDSIQMEYEESLVNVRLIRYGQDVLLMPDGDIVLERGMSYRVVRADGARLRIELEE